MERHLRSDEVPRYAPLVGKLVLREVWLAERVRSALPECIAAMVLLRERIRRNTSSRCQVSPGFGRLRRSLSAKPRPNLRHQRRLVSQDTITPRSAGNASTSLRHRLNTWIEPSGLADDLGREPVAVRGVRSLAHADSLH